MLGLHQKKTILSMLGLHQNFFCVHVRVTPEKNILSMLGLHQKKTFCPCYGYTRKKHFVHVTVTPEKNILSMLRLHQKKKFCPPEKYILSQKYSCLCHIFLIFQHLDYFYSTIIPNLLNYTCILDKTVWKTLVRVKNTSFLKMSVLSLPQYLSEQIKTAENISTNKVLVYSLQSTEYKEEVNSISQFFQLNNPFSLGSHSFYLHKYSSSQQISI